MKTLSSRIHILYIAAITMLMLGTFYQTLIWMYGRYTAPDSYYTHGFIIPFVTGYLIWLKRDRIALQHPECCWWGLLIVFFAAMLHVFGTLLYIYSISGGALLCMIIGAVLFVFGQKGTGIIIFPLGYLIFMLPLPLAVIEKISFPLKLLVAEAGVTITRLFGIPVFRDGFFISIPAGTLLVGNPCSGLRSLIAFLALGAILAYMSEINNTRKWLLFFSTIPIAIISNIIRIPLLILVSHHISLEAASPETWLHTGTGILVFIMGLFLLLTMAKLLHEKN